MYNPYSLKEKIILVTGASSGIGRATAIECSKMGANLILTGRNYESLEETKRELYCGENNRHLILLADLRNEEDCIELVNQLPIIDGVVSNAGIGKTLPLQFYSVKMLSDMFQMNCFSHMILLKLLIKNKKLKNNSSVVFVSSISGNSNTSIGNGMYGSSKSALNAYMKYAALELSGKGIRCNTVNPGRINTPLISNGIMSPKDISEDIKLYPLKRYGEPVEVAYAIVYLLSDASIWVTGTNLVIDGGRSLK